VIGAARGAIVLLAALACAGCLWRAGRGGIETPPRGAVVVDSDAALALHRRVEGFYLRLARRRFNTLETYNDFIMRDHFRSEGLFFDYFADLAESLDEANFEQNRPSEIEVMEFLFEDAQTALVQVRFVGEDDRPLNPFRTRLRRLDRWEWAEGAWWVRPGRL
jgi:hypothetical protein